MSETSFAAPEIAASRQRGIPADEGELWKILRIDAERVAAGEEMLRDFLDLAVLRHDGFASGLGLLLARKLAEYSMPVQRLGEIARAAVAGDPTILAAATADLVAIRTRDPAAENYLKPFLYYKGFHALQWQRIGHWLWRDGRRELAHFLQSRVSEIFAIDIHPAVPIGRPDITTLRRSAQYVIDREKDGASDPRNGPLCGCWNIQAKVRFFILRLLPRSQ